MVGISMPDLVCTSQTSVYRDPCGQQLHWWSLAVLSCSYLLCINALAHVIPKAIARAVFKRGY